MILTDGIHLVSDASLDELHDFATRIGLKREWFQCDHYDITSRRFLQAVYQAGAQQVSTREVAQRMVRCK